MSIQTFFKQTYRPRNKVSNEGLHAKNYLHKFTNSIGWRKRWEELCSDFKLKTWGIKVSLWAHKNQPNFHKLTTYFQDPAKNDSDALLLLSLLRPLEESEKREDEVNIRFRRLGQIVSFLKVYEMGF